MRRIVFAMSFIPLLAGCCAASSLPPTGQATRIETDQKTGVIRFIVDGEEKAYIDKNGFGTKGITGPAPVSPP
jgi:hypothetical protein